MQRDILFRAKSLKNRGWVYGFYYNVYEKSKGKLHLNHYIISGQVAGKEFGVFAVNGDTVSQYVGLKDKNGAKIFGGDLLEDNYNDEETLIDSKVEVVFDVKKAEWAIDNSFKQDKSSFTSLVGYFGDELKVIGNIHDE